MSHQFEKPLYCRFTGTCNHFPIACGGCVWNKNNLKEWTYV
jgi:hypothetical protein